MAQARAQPRRGFPAAAAGDGLAPYIALTKPRVIELLLVTTLPAMFLAAGGWPGGGLILATLIGGTLTAGAANAFNMVLDRDIDSVMARTKNRPLPRGKLRVSQAVLFGAALGTLGPLWLWATVGGLAAALTAGGLIFYVAVYTAVLKRRTVHNIVIGGAAGAVPALVGWAAVTGELGIPAWLLFAVVFLWTPPHFWALAVVCERDYASAAVPMLPVARGREKAARSSLRYAAATVAASLALPLVHLGVGWLYLAAASCLGALFIGRAAQFRADPVTRTAHRLFTFSIVYLAVLSGSVVVDQVMPPGGL